MLDKKDLKEIENLLDKKLDQRVAEIDRRFDQVEQHFSKVDQQFEIFEKRIDQNLDQRFEIFEKRIDQKLDQRFKSELKPIKSDIARFAEIPPGSSTSSTKNFLI